MTKKKGESVKFAFGAGDWHLRVTDASDPHVSFELI